MLPTSLVICKRFISSSKYLCLDKRFDVRKRLESAVSLSVRGGSGSSRSMEESAGLLKATGRRLPLIQEASSMMKNLTFKLFWLERGDTRVSFQSCRLLSLEICSDCLLLAPVSLSAVTLVCAAYPNVSSCHHRLFMRKPAHIQR